MQGKEPYFAQGSAVCTFWLQKFPSWGTIHAWFHYSEDKNVMMPSTPGHYLTHPKYNSKILATKLVATYNRGQLAFINNDF